MKSNDTGNVISIDRTAETLEEDNGKLRVHLVPLLTT